MPINKTPKTTMEAPLNLDSTDEDIQVDDHLQSQQATLVKYIQTNLSFVKGLEDANMYAAAINFLKKSLIALDDYISEHQDSATKITDNLLIEVNVKLASCYWFVNEIGLSVSYARKALQMECKTPRTMYLIGRTLLRCKEYIHGYNVLKEAHEIAHEMKDEEYEKTIESEMKKYEKRVQRMQAKQEKEAETASTSAVTSKSPSLNAIVDKEEAVEPVKIVKKEVKEVPKKSAPSSSMNVGKLYCFAGTVLSSSVGSWLIMKNCYNVSEKKSVLYSLGVGALIGGVCAFVLGKNSQSTPPVVERKKDSGSLFEDIAKSD